MPLLKCSAGLNLYPDQQNSLKPLQLHINITVRINGSRLLDLPVHLKCKKDV